MNDEYLYRARMSTDVKLTGTYLQLSAVDAHFTGLTETLLIVVCLPLTKHSSLLVDGDQVGQLIIPKPTITYCTTNAARFYRAKQLC